MITHLKGKLIEKNPTNIVLDCNGVGYSVNISLHTFSQLPSGENVKLFIHLQVREDSHTLFGFSSKVEREVFRLLISVSGIGASIARTMLSTLSPEQVMEAITQNNGAKTAQRVVLDLKDKIIKIYGLDEVSLVSSNTKRNEALSALETLGFARKQVEKICDDIVNKNPNASAETIIKQALKNL